MKPQLHRPQADSEYYFHEGCHILEIINHAGDPQLSVARARVASGATTRWHSLDGITERYYILQGRGRVELGDELRSEVGPCEAVVIPPGCAQRITNTGDGELIFLAICTPRFELFAYQDLDSDDQSDHR